MTSTEVPPAQCLGTGAAGVALLQIEQARAGLRRWEDVHERMTEISRESITAHRDQGALFFGAPAVAYVLHTAGHPAYWKALATLDDAIAELVHRRVREADRRIDRGELPRAAEFDLISGITGLATYLMHRHGDHQLLRHCLKYLVRLTQPLSVDGNRVPGWWASGSPDIRASSRWAGGHGGFGMAHGIAGPLALLSLAMQLGVIVDGHATAIYTICTWFDRWQVGHGPDARWPEVIDRHELDEQQAGQDRPSRPSWCYGTPGIARGQRFAGVVLGDADRVRLADESLLNCTTDAELARLGDASLCHGWAGLVHTLWCAAEESDNPDIAHAAATTQRRMRRYLDDHGTPRDHGLLEGTTGIQLAELFRATDEPGRPRWETCLLVRTPQN